MLADVSSMVTDSLMTVAFLVFAFATSFQTPEPRQQIGTFYGSTRISRKGVLDSGASKTVSSQRSDFESISAEPSVIIKTANGETRGYIGVLKHNKLGLTSGVYVPGLSVPALVSVADLLEAGWEIRFSKKGSTLSRDGKRQKIRFTYQIFSFLGGWNFFSRVGKSS